MKRSVLALILLATATMTSGCVGPLIVGGAAAIGADEIAEREGGGDGLF